VNREQELKLRTEEFDRQRQKDVEEAKRRNTLAGKTRYYGDVMKHSLPKMPHNAGELPSYLELLIICLLCTKSRQKFSPNCLYHL